MGHERRAPPVKQRKRNDVFAGNDAPVLRVERLPKRTEHRKRRKPSMGKLIPAKKGSARASARVRRANEKDQDAETRSGQRKKKKGRAAGTGKRSSQRHKGWREKPVPDASGRSNSAANAPKRVVVIVLALRRTAHGAAAHGCQAPSGANSTRTVPARMRKSRRRLQFSM